MNPIVLVGLEWLGSLGLFLAFIFFVRYLDHRERMAMIARGLAPARGRQASARRGGSAALRGGMITAMVGLAVTFALYTLGYLLPPPFNAVPGRFGPWLLPGLIPLGVGLALIASHYMAASQDMMAALSGEEEANAPERSGDNVRDDVRANEALEGRAPRPAGEPGASWRVLGGDATARELDDDPR